MKKQTELKVGQALYQPPKNHHRGWGEFTVVSIGNKWATLSGVKNRCTLDTLLLDQGGYSPVQLYVSREAYEQVQELGKAWRELGRQISSMSPPDGTTLSAISKARFLLLLADPKASA